MHKRLLLLLLIVILVPLALYAGTTGKISGRVVDENGDPLPGANVMIVGTTMGAATDANGYYFIINIRPGLYSVQAQMIGYQDVIQKEVRVVVDQNTKIDFQLTATVLSMEAVEIVAERPLIQRDQTASATVATSEEIETMPVETFNEVMVLTPGFVESGTGAAKERQINVRGSRSGELAYMIDGFYVEEPIGGGMGSNVTNVGIAELATLTGTFSAEYGEALSGVLNIVTKEGGSKYEGRIRFRTDKYITPHKFETIRKIQRNGQDWITADDEPVVDAGTLPVEPGQNKFSEKYWTRETKKVNDFDTYRTDFNLSGPLPFISKNHTFFVSGEYVDTKTYLGWTGMPYQKDLRLNGKLILKPFNNLKLTIGGVFTDEEWKTYNHSYKYIPDKRETNYRDDYMVNFTLTHTLGAKTFYTLKGARFTTNYNYRMKGWTEKDYFSYQDENGKWHIKNPDGTYTGKAERIQRDEEYEFWGGWWVYERDDQGAVIDSTWHTGGGGTWDQRENTINTLKLDLTSQMTRVHQVKLGFETKMLDLMRLYI
ncbi:MAG: carboxypeptidase regulatory-like domain-containing protein, partial [bacterium]